MQLDVQQLKQNKIEFNRNELAGAFGDMGTDFPLLVGVIIAAGMDAASVLIMFGLMQVFSGLVYKMPMPVQPLKAVAALVIAKQISPAVIYGSGIAIGGLMLLLAVIGGLDWLARAIPKCVIRGIQFGLGLQLASVALAKYVQSDGNAGILLAVLAFVISILLLNNKRLPAALPVIGLGILFALLVKSDAQKLSQPVVAICLPQFSLIGISDIITGFLLLSLPQIPLSIGNSVLATAQITKDLFPARNVSVKKIGITYGIMNLIVPWFGGFPVCHGSGGLVGHYTFGGRTGGSVIIYGSVFLVLGVLFGKSFGHIINIFPLPMLGVLLLFESLGLIYHSRDIAGEKTEFPITILVGLIAAFLAYGFVIGMIIGVGIYYFKNRVNLTSDR